MYLLSGEIAGLINSEIIHIKQQQPKKEHISIPIKKMKAFQEPRLLKE